MSEADRDTAFLEGGGEMTALMRVHDWSSTSIGPFDAWPQSLKTATGIVLRSPVPMVLLWGADGVMIYNEAYSVFAGNRHPGLLGSKVREGWPEAAAFNDHVMKTGLAGGVLSFRDQELTLYRGEGGRPEQVWMDLDYSPVHDDDARIGGVIAVVVDTTARVMAERRLKAERDRLYRLFEQAPGFIIVMQGAEHRVDFVNAAHRRVFGSDEWPGRAIQDAFPEVEPQGFLEILDRVYRTGERHVFNGQCVRFSATRDAPPEDRFVNFLYEPILDPEGRVEGVFCEGHDVTDSTRADRVVRESEARLRFLDALFQSTARLTDADAILAVTTRMVAEHLNLSSCAYADMEPDEDGFTIRGDWSAEGSPSIVGRYSLADFGRKAVEELSAGRPLVINDNRAELSPDEAATFQAIGITATICMPLVKDGRLTALMAIHDKVPRTWTPGELALITEVTERSWAHIERVRAEARLHEEQERYRTLFETVQAGFCIVEILIDDQGQPADYRFVETNPAFELQTGLVEAAGRTALELVPDLERHWIDLYGQVGLTGEALRFEQGSEPMGRWFDVQALRIGPPEARRVAILFNDITERRAHELAVQRMNEELERRVTEALAERKLLADIVEGAEAFVQVVDPDFRFLAINHASADEFERIYGVRPRVGDDMRALLVDQPEHARDVETIWRRALEGETFTEIAPFGDPGRDRRFYEMRFSPLVDDAGRRVGAYQFVYDVTERLREQRRLQEAEEALRQSQKMETIGQLTGGVAHDFNNLLTPIVGALDLLRRRLGGDERALRLTEGALQAADRARTLVQRLLAFSRRQHLEPRPVDVAGLVRGLTDLISRSIGLRIELRVEIADSLPAAAIDPNQLELALLNLAVNARDAMPDGGILTLSVWRETLREARDLAAGTYIGIAVRDTGSGMDEETLSRAIEPFFTTKGVGRGTGLGLSSVHGLAVQSGGAFRLDSAPGQGTTAILWLPVSDQPAEPIEIAESQASDRPPATVLLVDDEDLVRSGSAAMLEDAGFQVMQAASPFEALQMIEEGAVFDALVTDYAMPGMTGSELALEVRRIRPEARVLMITGYANLSDGDAGGLPRLAKPFRQSELTSAVADLLDA